MDTKQLVIIALQCSIWATVFSFGLKAHSGDRGYLARHTNLLARAIVAMLVVMPVAAIILARLFNFDPNVEAAIIALALAPIPPLLPGKETRAGVILKSILAPLLLGLAVRGFAPTLADKLAGPVSKLAGVLLLLGIVPLLIAVFPVLGQLVTPATLLAFVLFNVIGLTVGHLMGGPDPDQSVVLALSTASRHPMIAISIATANRLDPKVGATILLALLVNAVVGGLYVAWHRRQHPVPAAGVVRHA